MEYSSFDISKKMGIRMERLREWIDRGYIKPSIQKAQGRGTKNLFSKHDLYLVGLFKHLFDSGFSRGLSARRVEKLRHQFEHMEDLNPEEVAVLGFPFRESISADSTDPAVMKFKEGRGLNVNLYHGSEESGLDNLLLVNFAKIRKQIDRLFE